MHHPVLRKRNRRHKTSSYFIALTQKHSCRRECDCLQHCSLSFNTLRLTVHVSEARGQLPCCCSLPYFLSQDPMLGLEFSDWLDSLATQPLGSTPWKLTPYSNERMNGLRDIFCVVIGKHKHHSQRRQKEGCELLGKCQQTECRWAVTYEKQSTSAVGRGSFSLCSYLHAWEQRRKPDVSRQTALLLIFGTVAAP